jgi:hypothetical protein
MTPSSATIVLGDLSRDHLGTEGTVLAKSDYKKLTRFAQGDRGLTPAARQSALYVDF